MSLKKTYFISRMNLILHKSDQGLLLRVRTKKNILISQPKHMLWVLKRTALMRRFF